MLNLLYCIYVYANKIETKHNLNGSQKVPVLIDTLICFQELETVTKVLLKIISRPCPLRLHLTQQWHLPQLQTIHLPPSITNHRPINLHRHIGVFEVKKSFTAISSKFQVVDSSLDCNLGQR